MAVADVAVGFHSFSLSAAHVAGLLNPLEHAGEHLVALFNCALAVAGVAGFNVVRGVGSGSHAVRADGLLGEENLGVNKAGVLGFLGRRRCPRGSRLFLRAGPRPFAFAAFFAVGRSRRRTYRKCLGILQNFGSLNPYPIA